VRQDRRRIRVKAPAVFCNRTKTSGWWQRLGGRLDLWLKIHGWGLVDRHPAPLSDGAKGVLKEAVNLFFAQLGSSRIMGSLCDAAGYIAGVEDFGSRENNDIEDLANASAVVNWGKDFSRSSLHTAAWVHKARKKGAHVLTLSPGGDGNDPFCDSRIRLRPGTDRFLAAAVIRRLIEEGRIPEDVLIHTRQPSSSAR
jgi:hypothetical protein